MDGLTESRQNEVHAILGWQRRNGARAIAELRVDLSEKAMDLDLRCTVFGACVVRSERQKVENEYRAVDTWPNARQVVAVSFKAKKSVVGQRIREGAVEEDSCFRVEGLLL